MSLLIFAGCAMLGGRAGRQPAQPPPGGFAWAGGTLEGRGTGSAPANVEGEPQRSIVARRAAKTAAIANLKQQVRRLPVTDAQSVGSVMAQNLAVKRAIEQALQAAKVVAEKETRPGVFEVRVQLRLAEVADALARNNITSEGVPPLPRAEPSDVPPLS